MSELEAYKKAYEREKVAREIAENLLDEKTRELYDNVLNLEGVVDKLKSTQAQLIQSEKMASLGQLTAGVAHEINNPISYSYSNLACLSENITEFFKLDEFMCKQVSSSEEVTHLISAYQMLRRDIDADYLITDTPELLADTIDGIERVRKIVNNLKKLSYKGDDDFIICNVNDCIKDCLKLLANELKYTMEINLSLNDCGDILGQPSELSQVFINLFINASHACGKGGLLSISTNEIDGNIEALIRDNGQGIEEEALSKIFDPFYTTKPIGEGTGLGLPVSHGIIEKHNGRILVESEIGEGTTFIISIPAYIESS